MPGLANPRGLEACNAHCLSLDKVLNILRKDLEQPVLSRNGKSVVFLVVLNLVRGPCGGSLTIDVSQTAPSKTCITCCVQNKVASLNDGQEGHSPLVKALLHPKRGFFADGVALQAGISNVSFLLAHKGRHPQDLIVVGREVIPPGFCLVKTLDAQCATNSQKVKKTNGRKQGIKDETQVEIDNGIDMEDEFLHHIDALEEKGDVTGIVDGMSRFVHHSGVQESACRALWFLAADDEIQGQIASNGGIESVVEAMLKHPTVAAVQQAACDALWNIAANNAANQAYIAEAGGIERVVEAMTQHHSVAAVQEAACGALANFVANKASNQAHIVGVGGIECVIEAMLAHPIVVGVQEQGCAALVDLARNSPVNQIKIADAGGLERIMKAMTAFPSTAGLQEQACHALRILAGNSENKSQIAWGGGIQRSLAAMKEHPKEARVCEQAIVTLRSLAANSVPNQTTIASAGGIESVLTAMASHPAAVRLQAAACAFLLVLSSQPRLLERMKAAGGIERLQQLVDPTDVISSMPWRPFLGSDSKNLAQDLLGKMRGGPSSPTSTLSPARRLSLSSNEGSPLLPVVSGARHFGETISKGSGLRAEDVAVAQTSSSNGQSDATAISRIGSTVTSTGARVGQFLSAAGKHLRPSWM